MRFVWPSKLFFSRMLVMILLAFSLGTYLVFALDHLEKFETADEHLWVSDLYTGRIQKYWDSVTAKDWPDTRINDKPGVTLALISGIGMRWETDVEKKMIQKENLWSIYNPYKTVETYFLYRLPIVFCNGIMGIFFFIALLRLTRRRWLALVGAGLILVSPILIGISQIINPDAVLWVFSFAAILSFMLFLRVHSWWQNIIDGLLTAIFLGLAFLAKYVALILFPFFVAMILWYLFDQSSDLLEQKRLRKKALFIGLGFPLIIAGAIGTIMFLMPAAWVDHKVLYKMLLRFKQMREIANVSVGIIAFIFFDALLFKSFLIKYASKYLRYLKEILPRVLYAAMLALFGITLINWGMGTNMIHIPIYTPADDSGVSLQQIPILFQFILESKTLVFSLTPVALLLIMFLWFKSLFKRNEFDWMVFVLTAFVAIFYYASIQQKLILSIRYGIVLYPIVMVLAGFGFYELTKKLRDRYIIILFAIVAYASVLSIQRIQPYYFNYTNDLLPKKFSMANSWGYGGYEAVQYIVAQGDAQKIYTDYYGVCQFFPGKCVAEGQSKWMNDQGLMNIDYVITSYAGSEKNQPGLDAVQRIIPLDEPVWELDIDGRPDNFIRVYKNNRQPQQCYCERQLPFVLNSNPIFSK